MTPDPNDHVTIDEAFQLLLPFVKPYKARVLLSSAIADGTVDFYADGKKVGGDWFESYFTISVNKHADGQWQAELRMVRPIANFHTTNWTVSRLQVIALSEELKPLGHAVGGKRGRKVKFSWDRMVAEVIRCVHEEGIPSSKSYGTLASDLAEWCKNQNFKDNEIPEIDNIRKKLGVWLSLVPRE